jgi:hypothetical protein
MIQWDNPHMQAGKAALFVRHIPVEVQRGMRMVAARRNVPIRVWLIASLYELIDRELSDYPEWRYQSERPARPEKPSI